VRASGRGGAAGRRHSKGATEVRLQWLGTKIHRNKMLQARGTHLNAQAHTTRGVLLRLWRDRQGSGEWKGEGKRQRVQSTASKHNPAALPNPSAQPSKDPHLQCHHHFLPLSGGQERQDREGCATNEVIPAHVFVVRGKTQGVLPVLAVHPPAPGQAATPTAPTRVVVGRITHCMHTSANLPPRGIGTTTFVGPPGERAGTGSNGRGEWEQHGEASTPIPGTTHSSSSSSLKYGLVPPLRTVLVR
jgi:hypothetical protein